MAGVCVSLAVLALLPILVPSYYAGLVVQMLVWGIFAMSLGLLLGYAGLPSLGHAAYFGTAAYAVGILSTRVVQNFWVNLLVGVGMAALAAAILGVLAVRARGPYFLLITLALAQVVWGIAWGWRSLTRGDDGLPGIHRPDLAFFWSLQDARGFYYVVLVSFLIAALLMYLVQRSHFGHVLVGIRENEVRMRVLGYHVSLYKYGAFVLAGAFAGFAGVWFAYYNGFVSPTGLSMVTSGEVLLMVIVGGAQTLLGPVVGAALVVLLENIVSAYTERWVLIMGLVYILTVFVAPRGIFHYLERWLRREPTA